jgi:hypothetical protein
VTLERLASFLGWAASRLDAAIDTADDRVQLWPECPDGPSIVMGAGEVMERGLSGGDDGRWVRPGMRRVTGRKIGLRTCRESELNGRPDEEGLAEMIADDAPSPLDSLIAAEERAGMTRVDGDGEPMRSRGRPSDLGHLLASRAGSSAQIGIRPIGDGPTWHGPSPRQVGTARAWHGRRVDGRGVVVVRGEVEESAAVAPRCPGCGGRHLRPFEFCLRCSSPPAAAPPRDKARRLGGDFAEASAERMGLIRATLRAPATVVAESAGSIG